MLLVMLLGLADFGRVFSAGITMEAAARNAAEAAAQEYVQLVRNRPGGLLVAADYTHLHAVAVRTVCSESETLPFKASPPGATPVCMRDDPSTPTDPTEVGAWPLAAVCVQDDTDPYCGTEADPPLAECNVLNGSDPTNGGAAPMGSTPLPHVEVRVCYHFTTLWRDIANLQLPFGWSVSLGDVYLQRTRDFTVANY